MTGFKWDTRIRGKFLYGKKQPVFTVLYRLYNYCWAAHDEFWGRQVNPCLTNGGEHKTIRRQALVALALLLWLPPALRADTIYHRCLGDLRRPDEEVVATEVLVDWVNKNEEGKLLQFDYYSWDKQKRLIVDSGDANFHRCSDEEFRVVYSEPAERAKLIARILEAGVRARVTTSKGSKADYYCLQSHYDFPGVIFLDGDPSDDTSVHLEQPGTGAPMKDIRFADLAEAVFKGDVVSLTTKDGTRLSGMWRGVTASGHLSKVVLKGLDSRGKRLSTRLDDVFKIEFIR